ncbi:ABC transporter substrate-binding protein [Ruania halotolerans]|uniref:ABC transporter substrate-binding protein n=1 Tax=Ruania halotolerans TaxID=2897773 RepID=UPI001E2A371F|nr:ABC transporter substrate-binding protein [Ruania halotolerans]UFU06834.1 ABC transporter substrate-binding protein [Ruania halotolerans]
MATWQWARTSRTRTQRLGARTDRRRPTGLAACAVAVALVLAGCSGDGPGGSGGGGEGDATLMLAADKGSPTFEENFNPYLQNKRSATSYIYEPLIMVNPLDAEQVPWLAESWEQPDPATIEMTLREGVTWTDGEPLTTEDIAFTFELIQEYPALDTRGAWNRIESVETTDTMITFHLQGDDTPALPVIGQTLIVPEHIWAEQDAPDTWANTEPVGTGPFTLGNFTPQQYTMDRNPDYWGEVAIDQIVLPSATEQLDIVNGNFDWGYSFMSDVENTWVGADENNTYWFPPGGVLGLLPNHDVQPFDDVHVRRGIALALDKGRIAEVASEGYMDAASQTGLLLPNHEELLAEDIPDSGIIAQDADAAIAAFEQAGFTHDGSTMRTPDGQPFTFAITTPNGYTDWLRAVQEIQRQLAEIGIEVDINSPQAAAYEANLSSGDYEMAFGGGLGGGDPYASYNSLLSSEFYAPNGETTQNNRIRYQSQEADDLLVAYRSAVEEAEQERIIGELQHLMFDELPGIAVYHGGMWGLFNDGRFTGWPSAEDPYASPQTWDSAPLLILTRLEPVQ